MVLPFLGTCIPIAATLCLIQVPIMDANKFLTDGTKAAIKTGAQLAKGKITVLVVDEEVRTSIGGTSIGGTTWEIEV